MSRKVADRDYIQAGLCRLASGRAVSLFGFAPSEAIAEIFVRDPFWRGSRALLFGGIGLILAPVAALVPPHAPWAIGALVMGAIMSRRKWAERHTLVTLRAACPQCEASLRLARPTRLRFLMYPWA